MKMKHYCPLVLLCGAMMGLVGLYCYYFESLCFSYVQDRLQQFNRPDHALYQEQPAPLAVTGDDNGCVLPFNPKKGSQTHQGSKEGYA